MTAKKGWGVRARQSIAKNSFILEYTGEICSKEEFERRMLVRYKVDNHHYCLAMDNKMMIDAHRAGSECRLELNQRFFENFGRGLLVTGSMIL